jgi:hypothetical protein
LQAFEFEINADRKPMNQIVEICLPVIEQSFLADPVFF